jgi:hypothetical protein
MEFCLSCSRLQNHECHNVPAAVTLHLVLLPDPFDFGGPPGEIVIENICRRCSDALIEHYSGYEASVIPLPGISALTL